MAHHSVAQSSAHPGRIEQLLADTLYLLSRSATVGVCRGRLRNVLRHLDLLAAHPESSPEVKKICARLLEDWLAAQQENFPIAASEAAAPERLQ